MHSFDDLPPEERARIKRQNREAWRESWFGTKPSAPHNPEPYREGSKIGAVFTAIFEIVLRVAALVGALYVLGHIAKACH